MTAKEELQLIRNLDHRVERKLQDIEQLETMINRATGCIRGVIVQGGQKADQIDSIDRLIELRQAANAEIDRFVDLKTAVTDKLDRIDDPLLSDILYSRYVKYLAWDEIERQYRYDLRYIHKLHGKALEAYGELSKEDTKRHQKTLKP